MVRYSFQLLLSELCGTYARHAGQTTRGSRLDKFMSSTSVAGKEHYA